jgi:cytochrome c oxidase subunit 2
MEPAGPAAERINTLWWIMLVVATAVFVGFVAFMLYAAWHPRTGERPDAERIGNRLVVLGGIIFPAVVVTALFFVTLGTLRALGPPRDPARIVIDVTGKLWWWEVRYAGAPPAITANEIHIPAGEPVEVRLLSDNVIHSFWVPELHGKLDLVPGKANVIRLEAHRPGVYRGQCAEYCGLQHARMAFLVVAQPRAEFDAWLARQRQSANMTDPALAAGRSAFEFRCGTCHTVRGTQANGTEGPDLTHLASRRTLAAVTLPNDVAGLGGWIVHSQSIKPGNLMPNVDLPREEFHAIMAYLRSLN